MLVQLIERQLENQLKKKNVVSAQTKNTGLGRELQI